MDWSITLNPVLPWAAIAVLAAVGLALLALMAYARSRGLWLRKRWEVQKHLATLTKLRREGRAVQ